MKIVLLNVKYSNNLGDGVIAECLEKELQKTTTNAEVSSIDLGGREFFKDDGAVSKTKLISKYKDTLVKLFQILPLFLQKQISQFVSTLVINKKAKNNWYKQLQNTDHVILGGGQLIADEDFYFPVRIHAALSVCNKLNLPISVYGVGVAKNLSVKAINKFSQFFIPQKLNYVVTRDEVSSKRWKEYFKSPVIEVCQDSGLLSCDNYIKQHKDEATKVVGIGVMCNKIIEKYSSGQGKNYTESFYVDLAKKLNNQGVDVAFFTNGAPEDEVLKDKIADKIGKLDNVSFAPHFTKPNELVEFISGLNGLIAHRLHANIVAYSFQVPHLGMGWDDKLRNFFISVNREEYFLEHNISTENISNLILQSIKEGIDTKLHSDIISKARMDIKKLSDSLNTQKKAA